MVLATPVERHRDVPTRSNDDSTAGALRVIAERQVLAEGVEEVGF